MLPNIPTLHRLLQSLATLDAILSPEWEYRYYSFNSHWDKNETLGSMRNGEGDAFFVHFSPAGAFIKGFHHESKMSPYEQDPEAVWPGVTDTVPPEFLPSLNEPAFGVGETTFALWRSPADSIWHRGEIIFPAGEDPDGSAALLALLDNNPESYVAWATEYYMRPVPSEIVQHIYAHTPLSMALIAQLNPEVVMEDFLEDIKEIGYPPVTDFPPPRPLRGRGPT